MMLGLFSPAIGKPLAPVWLQLATTPYLVNFRAPDDPINAAGD
jgi:hypothetical protein